MKIKLNGTEMYPTRYATGEDLKGRAYTLEIAQVCAEKMTDPHTRQEVEKHVIYFVKAKRGFVLGKEFAESIAQTLGEWSADKWTGKHVEIYSKPTRLGLGVRARTAPNGVTPTPEIEDEEE